MKKALLTLAGAAVALSSTAMAGFTQPAPVVVDLDNRTAAGDMITARDAKSDNVLIGCGIRAFDDGLGGTFEFGFCQAVNEDEERGFCTTQNSELLDNMRAMTDASWISFSWNENDECIRFGFSNQSFYLDKHTKGNQKGNER